MKYLLPFKNWRIVVLTVMVLVAMLLIFCDGDDLEALVCAKAIGIAQDERFAGLIKAAISVIAISKIKEHLH